MNLVADWTCSHCHTLFTNDSKDTPFQVDYINDTHLLCSNYDEQHYIKHKHSHPYLNEIYCSHCVYEMNGLKIKFSKEQDYTFEQNGMTCWNMDKMDNYKRECGLCCHCKTLQTLPSLFNTSSKLNEFMLLWSPYLCSLAFPNAMKCKVYILNYPSKFYFESNEPLILCQSCFEKEEWIEVNGPIVCQFCNQSYARWVNHWYYRPVNISLFCCAHQPIDEDCIYDGIIDPESFQWHEKPLGFDSTRPFCNQCLTQFVNCHIIESEWEIKID
jgi:hypothetical protein